MLVIARSELVQIFRNRLVLVTGLIIPVAVGALLRLPARGLLRSRRHRLHRGDRDVHRDGLRALHHGRDHPGLAPAEPLPQAAALHRRERPRHPRRAGRCRWSSSRCSRWSRCWRCSARSRPGPARLPLLAVVLLATTAMMVGLALATAGLTNSPEHAQVTTLPVSLLVIAVASWVGITGTEDLVRAQAGCCPEARPPNWSSTPGTAASRSATRCACCPDTGWVVVATALARPAVPLGAEPMSLPVARRSSRFGDTITRVLDGRYQVGEVIGRAARPTSTAAVTSARGAPSPSRCSARTWSAILSSATASSARR